jgi:hypothetical protein
MLVTFKSEVGNLTMFGDVALQLIRAMGHSGTIPSAILAQDLPAAIARLEAALAAGAPADNDEPQRDDEEVKVSLHLRAHPLLELMRRAVKEDADLMWDKG